MTLEEWQEFYRLLNSLSSEQMADYLEALKKIAAQEGQHEKL